MANKSNSSVHFLGESKARQSAFRFYLTLKKIPKIQIHNNLDTLKKNLTSLYKKNVEKEKKNDYHRQG